MNYYKLPLKFSSFLEKNELGTCEIRDSIAQNIHLLNTTYFGECTFNYEFGSAIWEMDFDNLKSRNNLKGLITKSLESAIEDFEKRLTNVTVKVNVDESQQAVSKSSVYMKKAVTISIKGKIIHTNEDFIYTDFFYIGPLSY